MIIDPNLLQLVGLGIQGDPYLLDGRHLRWFFGRMLGFPRSGFRLRRRRNARDFEGLVDFIRRQSLTQAALTQPLTLGVRVSKHKGLVFQPAFPNDGPALRVDEQPVWLDFENGYPPVPEAADPAAYVMLVFARRSSSGVVEATGWYDTRGAAVPRYRSIQSAAAGSGGGKPGTSPWVYDSIVLHGGLLDRVEITGRDAVLVEVRWLPTAHYANAPDWEEIGLFYLPFTGEPAIYPDWSPNDGASIAKQRLDEAPPQARAPWDEPNHPPPPLDPATAAEIWADLMARHLDGAAFDTTHEAMKLFLEGELVQIVPQALVEFEVQLEPESPVEGEEPAQFKVRPFDTLYAGAVDPARARLLGLLTSDFTDPGDAWDYTIDADYPELWIRWMTDPEGAAAEAAALRKKFGSKPFPWQDVELVPRQRVLSMATCIEQGKVPLPAPPPDLKVDLVPRPLGEPVQADAALSWLATDRNLFEAPDEVRIAFAVRRVVEGEDVAMHPLDPDLLEQGRRAPVPHLPTAESVERYAGRCRIMDTTLERYTLHEWRVSGMDLFGRFSPFATVQEKVVDLIAPPAPPAVRAVLEGDGPSWKLVAEWEWPAEAANLAPDFSRFEVHLRQGAVSPADAKLPGTWGRFENVVNATTLPLSVSLAGSVNPPGAGLTASATVTLDGTTRRFRLEASPVTRAFDAK
ncbi:MAG TPA: hypothetical protein VEL74_02490, partial [Thermoanaerobaculia bacterium]|nr:hypothetical protein [Thermoanaerobaculia bacterium]